MQNVENEVVSVS